MLGAGLWSPGGSVSSFGGFLFPCSIDAHPPRPFSTQELCLLSWHSAGGSWKELSHKDFLEGTGPSQARQPGHGWFGDRR